MRNSKTNARNVALNFNHVFPWKWNLSDLSGIEKNNLKVFSCFSCGGGSSMGYKLAGYEVIGNCEIDPAVMNVYKTNHHPKYSFLMDVRQFLNEDVPEELYNLDVLDGSPPCSVFSMAGEREDGWNKEKAFHEAGYEVQIFLLNSALMGVPQARERVFFIAHRVDLDYPKLKLSFNEVPIMFKDVRSEHGKAISETSKAAYLLARRREGDTKISDINKRLNGHNTGFTQPILSDYKVAPTLTNAGDSFRMYDGMICTDSDYRNMQSFPQDYDFCGQPVKYICGMSVPPVMMAHIAKEVYKQWLSR